MARFRNKATKRPIADLFATRTKLQPDYVRAQYWAQLAAEEGQPDAQALLGTVLSLGPEEMRDQTAAEEWYRRAAEGGSPQGHLGYGRALMSGERSEARLREAAIHMAKAADAGLPVAIYLLGVMLHHGIGVAADLVSRRATL